MSLLLLLLNSILLSAICLDEEIHSVIRFLIKGFVTRIDTKDDNDSNNISIGTVCVQALSSAEFFEIKSLRGINELKFTCSCHVTSLIDDFFDLNKLFPDNFLDNYLQELGAIFKNLSEDPDVKRLGEAMKEANAISLISQNEEKRKLSELHNFIRCFETTKQKSTKKIPINDKYIQKISRLISLLYLFPTEYFPKQEINILITLSLLIDRFISHAHFQKFSEVVNILKCSVTCRNLIRKFMSTPIRQDDVLVSNHFIFISFLLFFKERKKKT